MGWEPDKCLIPELLHKIGKTQQWLSEQTGISPQRISDYATKRVVMGIGIAKMIAELLNCHIDNLYTWKRQNRASRE